MTNIRENSENVILAAAICIHKIQLEKDVLSPLYYSHQSGKTYHIVLLLYIWKCFKSNR